MDTEDFKEEKYIATAQLGGPDPKESADYMKLATNQEIPLGIVAGVSNRKKTKLDKWGNERHVFLGEFSAVTHDGRNLFAKTLVMPAAIASLIIDKMENSEDGEVEFAFPVMAGPSDKSGRGYAFFVPQPQIKNAKERREEMRAKLAEMRLTAFEGFEAPKLEAKKGKKAA